MRISDWSSDVCSSDLRIGGSSSTIKIFGGVIASPGRVAQFLGPDPPVRAMLRKCSDASRCGEAKAVHRMHGPADPRSSYRASPFRQGVERSEEHTSELQSLMRISYAVFCLKKKKKETHI